MLSLVRAMSIETLQDAINSECNSLSSSKETESLYNSDFEIDYDCETSMFDDQCRVFVKEFVQNMFIEDGFICQEDKAKFGLLVQHQEGRGWFGKFVESQRTVNQDVDEFTFYRLVQYFAIVLFECNLADDFAPATSIMNMCFTYFFTSLMVPGRMGQASKQFVYEYLKDQPIWRSNRFWTAAFLHAIHADRSKRTDGVLGWNTMTKEQRRDYDIGEENSTFAHLASFLYMMKSFDVNKEDRDAFLQKMSVIGNLKEEHIHELEESIEILK